jgi:hypothetical protein
MALLLLLIEAGADPKATGRYLYLYFFASFLRKHIEDKVLRLLELLLTDP